MMPQFNAGRAFEPGLNIRDFKYLLDLLEPKNSFPNGVLWPLVAARRAGKTWALRALEDHLGESRALYLDLRPPSSASLKKQKKSCLLLDEPGQILKADPQGFIKACKELKAKGSSKIIMAMSPGEWEFLWELGNSTGHAINRDDLQYLEPLRDFEVKKLTDRAIWASELVRRLPEPWSKHPFLLETVLGLAEKRASLRETIPELLREAIEESRVTKYRYAQRVFGEGFSEAQRDLVRAAARLRLLKVNSEMVEVFQRCQILEHKGTEYLLADPILADHLPPPFRIHHVSDLHVGPKTADAVDVKAQGSLGKTLRPPAGFKPVRDAYLDHVNALPAHRKPHVVVVSGDIAEMGDLELYREAQEWLSRLQSLLTQHNHPAFPDGADTSALPRILLVGGNHDVNWRETFGPTGARKRHLPFAQAFEKYHRPRLEEPPGSRPVAHVSYGGDLGVEFLLLGSAEFGGQREEDEVWERLIDLLNEVRQETLNHIDKSAWDEVSKRLEHLSRIDPGLVHDQDLTRARKHRWEQPVRIAVLHHPVSPLPATEVASYTGLINAGQVKNMLMEKQFCLVLHGHMHFGWFAAEHWPGQHDGWTLHIAAAPTLGSRETQHELGYNVVEVSREGNRLFSVTVSRVSHDTGGGWPEKETMGPIILEFDGSRITLKQPG
jgi:3',5'-cyclic AMP phosphodiesterase CpdA